MRELYHNVLIVGFGCAGLSTAYNLKRLGVEDVAIACKSRSFGTSRNTGSDKQTYYKLSLCGDDSDSVHKMANELYSYGGINGDIALCEASGSVQGFMNLVSLGVPFPKNIYGEFVGYKTDFDSCKRGTSAGPLTSKYMVEALEKAVDKTDVKIIETLEPIKIIIDNGKAVGCFFTDGESQTVIYSNFLVFATGGEASLYFESVYPKSQSGAMGVLIDAGVRLANFNYWQYGMASVDFRWNVSGSYQQVIPRYISIDKNGNEAEFLRSSLTDDEIFEFTFLKGYQWPFDAKRINASSKIDILVKAEIDKGNKVCLDYMSNPAGFCFDKLSEAARAYLVNSNALLEKPIDRLMALNKKAYINYLDNGIDLANEYLRISICAQHQNGGADIDCDYQTNIESLYAVGECAGVFGAYRPGGSALNSTQVSGLRASESIFAKSNGKSPISYNVDELDISYVDDGLINKWQKITSEICLNIRDACKIKANLNELENDLANCKYYKSKEVLLSTKAFYLSCIFASENIGSNGCSIALDNGNVIPLNKDNKNKIVLFDGECSLANPRELPNSSSWFETEWQSFNERMKIK